MRKTGETRQFNRICRDEIYDCDHISPSQILRHCFRQTRMNIRIQFDHSSTYKAKESTEVFPSEIPKKKFRNILSKINVNRYFSLFLSLFFPQNAINLFARIVLFKNLYFYILAIYYIYNSLLNITKYVYG